MQKANDQLREFTGTSRWYKTILAGLTYTEGVKELCSRYRCYWFLDIIVSYQPEIAEGAYGQVEFQRWMLEKAGDGAIVYCYDRKGCLLQQEIEWTDFPFDQAEVWVAHQVIYLPSEE